MSRRPLPVYKKNISPRICGNSEAVASYFLENLEEKNYMGDFDCSVFKYTLLRNNRR